MSGKIVIVGAGGQMSRALAAQLGERAVTLHLQEVDFSKPDFLQALEAKTTGIQVDAVINAGAYTKVDQAESDRALAARINAEAVGELAEWCKERGIPLVHYSTEYVYDGSGDRPRREDAAPHPLSVYGQTKLAGDKAIEAAGGKHLIFRTSWIYDDQGQNFLNTMLRLFKEKESLNVVGDQIGAPTYAPHLAVATIKALDKALAMQEFPSGVYHLCNRGETSWHGFASAILEQAKAQEAGIACQRVNRITTAEYPTPAKRPLNSRLDCTKAQNVFDITMPDWRDGLNACMIEKYGHTARQHRRSEGHQTRRL